MNSIYIPFWIAFLVSAVLAYPTLLLLRAIKNASIISQYAPETHQQKQGTPNMGGLFVISSVLTCLLVTTEFSFVLFGVLIGFMLIGFIDDYVMPKYTKKRGLGWMPKLLLEIGIASLVFIETPIGFSSISTGFLIVASANAVNFLDGLDSLAATVAGIALLPFLGFFGMNLYPQGILILAIIGALIPFLFLNSPPAKLFLGDTGALPLGAAFGFIFASSPWSETPWPWICSFVIILELVLVPIQLAAVKTIGKRLFPATPIHHAFEVKGWPESKVLWLFIILQLVLSVLAISIQK